MEGPKDLRCLQAQRDSWRFDAEHVWTVTSMDQLEVEESVKEIYDDFQQQILDEPKSSNLRKIPEQLHLKRKALEVFLMKGLTYLPGSYSCLDASRPWICYWVLHSMEILNIEIPKHLKTQIPQFLAKCQDASGGFGGGPMQLPHLAPTYAAVNALCIIGTEEAYNVINRDTLYTFIQSMHQSDGSFILHEGGEVDIRGCYLAANVARLTNIITEDLFDKTAQWIVSCQTYEGGFGGVPGMEAHGGYAFCGVAALTLLGHEKLCDTDALLRWTVNRQMSYEGGFQGRTNKLVDACYSYWQSAIIPVLCAMPEYKCNKWIFHNGALQEYVLLCCQFPHGGFIDKPGKYRDYYHTCYALSGLSVSQHFTGNGGGPKPHVVGQADNITIPIHPVYNLGIKAAVTALEHFSKLPPLKKS